MDDATAAPAGPTIYELITGTPETRRTSGNFRHSVREVLTIAVLCELCGGHSARKCAAWGRENEGWLRARGLELPHGVPSHHTFSRVFAVLPPAVLKCLGRRWSQGLRDLDDGEVVAVDGKALKHASTDGVHVPYVVSAWASGAGFVMGELKTDEKSNEITAIPRLLEAIGDEIADCVVTTDAAGCQRDESRRPHRAPHGSPSPAAVRAEAGVGFAELRSVGHPCPALSIACRMLDNDAQGWTAVAIRRSRPL